jgi:hypothetical protein
VVKHDGADEKFSNSGTQNNSTLSSIHKEMISRRPPNKKSLKPNLLTNSINVGGGHVSDLFFANRVPEVQGNYANVKLDRSSIEELPSDRLAMLANAGHPIA